MDFDESRLYYSHQQLQIQRPNNSNNHEANEQQQQQQPRDDDDQVDWSAVRRHFREFLRNYRQGAHGYIYRERLLRMHRRVFGAERVNDDPISHGAGIQNNADTFRPSSSSSSNQHPVMIDVDLAHVGEYDTALLGLLLHQPAHVLPLVELAARDALRTLLYDTHSSQQQQQHDTRMDDDDDAEQQNLDHDGNAQPPSGTTTTNAVDDMMAAVGGIQILLKGNMALTPLRSIKSEHMHRLLKCPGIVISTSPIKSRAIQLIVRCSRCLHTQTMAPAADAGPFSAIVLPTRCAGPDPATCGTFPYGVVPDESQFWDRQTLKLQEAPETVPTGEMPRSVLLTVERALIDQAPPGTRVTVLCIPTLFSTGGNNNKGASAAVKSVYLRVVGMIKDDNAHDRDLFTPAEEEAFVTLSRRSDVYDILSRSVAPSISGSYTVDIKKALICLLLGGSRKRLPDGVRLRGDINVLLLGDPSTAKSQFLKFISRVAPIGIYTSGKGSSAAGLTASVVRDARGEFYLEGGAMVLADGGVVCIDEFDKMRPADRVAIHEAMEQQTISIAKAGITTVLNSRSSVLAAANPVFGRYDDFKSASENIDLMTTILSRFDLIFLVRDVRDEERDRLICRHVMGVHIGSNNNAANQNSMRHHGLTTSTNWRGHGAAGMGGGNDEDGQAGNHNMGDAMGMEGSGAASPEAIAANIMRVATTGAGELSVPAMKKYIQYGKAKCAPRLSEEAGQVLASAYVKIRDDVRRQSVSLQKQGGRGEASDQAAIPITIRQLEALIRVSESLAKMRLDAQVRAEDVAEALRLFRVSTMTANATDSHRNNQQSSSALVPLRNSTNTSANNNTTLGAANASMEELDRTENFVRSRLTLGGSLLNKQKLLEEAAGQGYDAVVVARVLGIMVMRGQVQERNQGRLVKRIK